MKIGALAPWFGANRVRPERVGHELGKLDWCGVPFMGGACELPHINCRSGVANDLHRHIVNLARVVRNEAACKIASADLSQMLFHEDEFRGAQQRCRSREVPSFALGGPSPSDPIDDILWAVDYFICCWMGPGARPGKNTEFTSYFASRWSATGGASVTRFRSAVESLLGWSTILKKWEFRVLDAFAFLGECADKAGHGIYCDPPWPEQGAEYKFAFSPAEHEKLAKKLSSFEKTRVVVRYGDCPLIRSLYADPRWRFVEAETKNQAGNAVPEVLIVNRPEFLGMSGYTPKAGDVIVIEARESGMQWFAKVDCVTKGGRVLAWWHQRTRKGGDTKPRALIPGKESLVRKAAPFEAMAFERGDL